MSVAVPSLNQAGAFNLCGGMECPIYFLHSEHRHTRETIPAAGLANPDKSGKAPA
jgi:hypothetical protein